MANSPQARKRARQANTRRLRNVAQRSKVRTSIKNVIKACNSSDATLAKSAFLSAQSSLDNLSRKGLVNKNTAARIKSRLNARVKALTAA